MPRRDFTNMVRVPTGNADLDKMLNAMAENIELLCGLRGDANNHAVVKGDIDTDYPDDPAVLDDVKETLRKVMVNLKT